MAVDLTIRESRYAAGISVPSSGTRDSRFREQAAIVNTTVGSPILGAKGQFANTNATSFPLRLGPGFRDERVEINYGLIQSLLPQGIARTSSPFGYKRAITIDYTQVLATLTDFPVLISFTHNDLRVIGSGGHVENSNGYDICFYSDEDLTVPLIWEMDTYISTTGVVVAWVKIPSLSHTVDTVIYIAYGNSSISTFQSVASDVWDSGYEAVWHFGDGTALSVLDSTGNHNGTNSGTTAASGQISGCLTFNSTDYVQASSGPILAGLSNWTMSAYFRSSAAYNPLGGGRALYAERDPSNGTEIVKFDSWDANSTGIIITYRNAAGNLTFTRASGTAHNGVWQRADVVLNAGIFYIYINGVLNTSLARNGNDVFSNPSVQSRIGQDPNDSSSQWLGELDELRLSSVVRSADWIETESNNQSSPSTFFALGSEEEASEPTFGVPVLDLATGSSILNHFSIASGEGFGSHTLLPGVVSLIHSGIASSAAFGSQTLSPGAVSLIHSSIASGQAFGSHTLIPGVATLAPGGITTSAVFGSQVLAPGLVNIITTGIAKPGSPFEYKKSITIDHTKVVSTLTDFPVLIHYTHNDLRVIGSGGHVQNSNGYDICFYSDEALTTPLKWEVESYNSTTGEIIARVKIPSLSDTVDTVIYVAYGNASISTFQSVAADVWDSDYVYAYNWSNPSSLDLNDSTANNNDGVQTGTVAAGAGKFAGGADFSNGNIYAPHTNDFNAISFTAEVWFKTGSGGTGTLIRRDNDTTGQRHFLLRHQANSVQFLVIFGGNPSVNIGSNANNNAWHYAAAKAVQNGANTDIYLFYDGSWTGPNTASGLFAGATQRLDHGWYSGSIGEPYAGSLDAPRFSKIARSDAWIETGWENQSDPATFYSVGSEEPGGSSLGMPILAASASLIHSSIASGQAFGSHALLPGIVSIIGNGISTGVVFGSQTIIPGALSIAPGGISTGTAFGSHTLSPGVVNLIISGVASNEAFGSQTLSAGVVNLSPSGVSSALTFGSQNLLPGARSLILTGISSTEALGTHVLFSATTNIVPSGIVTSTAFGTHTFVAGSVSIITNGIATNAAFGSSTLTSLINLNPSGVATGFASGSQRLQPSTFVFYPSSVLSLEAFGTASLRNLNTLLPPSISTGFASGTQSLNASAYLIHQSISSGLMFGSVSFRNVNTFLPSGVATGFVAGTQTLSPGTATISHTSIASGAQFGNTVFTSAGVITSIGIASGYASGSHILQPGVRNIIHQSITSLEALGAPVLSAIATINASSINSSELFGSVFVVVPNLLSPPGVVSSLAFGDTALYSISLINASGIASANFFGAQTLIPGIKTLHVTGIATQNVFGNPVFNSVASILAQGITTSFVSGGNSLQSRNYLISSGIATSFASPSGGTIIPGIMTLSSTGVPTAESFGNILVRPTVFINPGSISSSEAIGNVHLASRQILIAQSIESLNAFGTPGLIFVVDKLLFTVYSVYNMNLNIGSNEMVINFNPMSTMSVVVSPVATMKLTITKISE